MHFPELNVKGKVAVVTGGTKGLGLIMAKALAYYGAEVVITGRNEEDGIKAVDEIKMLGAKALFIQSDVTDTVQVKQMVEQAIDEFSKIDILVNNAGMVVREFLVNLETDDWDKVISTNLKGVFLVGREIAKQMIKQKSGRIINVSSTLGTVGMPRQTSYAASKGGVDQMTKVWAAELAPHNITVNAIAPAYFETPMTKEWLSDKTRRKEMEDLTLIGRIGKPEDLVGPIVFLASDSSAYVTGHILYVDGGEVAK
jgi:gluconate 5-dehydrogenase